ncbi:MAG: hypothetical protein ACRD24_05300 [Terriglobales bacterium]
MASGLPPSTTGASRIPWPFFFLFHTVFASVGVMVATSIGLSFINAYRPYPGTTYLKVLLHPFHPLQVGAMVMLGYIVPRELPRSSLARWAWVLPAVYLLLRMAWWFRESAPEVSVLAEAPPASPDVLAHFFGPCVDRFAMLAPQAGCLDQFTTTLPFQASLAYSAGALLDQFDIFRFRRSEHHAKQEDGKGGVSQETDDSSS